jgi:hypothetical protein
MVASKKTIEKYKNELDGLHGSAKYEFKQIAENITVIGKCGICNGNLIYHTKSTKENIWNYYCMPDSSSTDMCIDKFCRDARHPFTKDVFLGYNNPVTSIMQIQKEVNDFTIPEEYFEQELSVIACKE